ncbi:hypothetical protein [Paenibacillus sp. Soil522]|uniref:hypothetical protein n=1 Tax=Paenibacillus sp. Soil522 TaxID=1736388 RepID=UPI0006F87A67|nr:hypothetical protein [Paenibacillus sp. Soil522]KRE20917.1 hypothetical protein ASG81_29510 [Paenibacillus sp. Soil522]
MRSISFVFLILIILISGCSGSSQTKVRSKSMLYDFNEPFRFPFEVNEVRTEIAMDNPDSLQQYVFHYKNKQTTQEIKCILSKVIDEPEDISFKQGKQPLKLENGKQAYYEEDETSQSIWWEGDNGFVARFVYYINGNREQLDKYKLDKSDLIELANQVQ